MCQFGQSWIVFGTGRRALLISILNLSARVNSLPIFAVQHEGKISWCCRISHTTHSLVQIVRGRPVSDGIWWGRSNKTAVSLGAGLPACSLSRRRQWISSESWSVSGCETESDRWSLIPCSRCFLPGKQVQTHALAHFYHLRILVCLWANGTPPHTDTNVSGVSNALRLPLRLLLSAQIKTTSYR